MTRKEVEYVLAVWKERLRLTHWTIKIRWDEEGAPELETDDEARIKVADDYEEAFIRLAPEWSTWTAEELNRILVHELIHTFENDAGVAIEALEGRIPAGLFSLLECWYTHEVEKMVDRLALIIIELAGNVLPQIEA